ncbi:MAG: potassium channel family protein [Pseudomonadales bacterium]
MAKTSDLDRVTAVVLRFTRGPILVLVAVYAVGIIGMALMPGQDADGNPQKMSLFHAFYFFTYTATTTGFGEIPQDFTGEQRLWTIVCLYMGVVAWLYAIGSIIKLAQNPYFVNAVAERRFARSVRNIWSPFYVVCGFGDTGSLLTRGFSDHGLMAVVIDADEERIKALALRDYRDRIPGLCADASVPKHLVDAGITLPNCRGIVALSPDEDLNLKIAVMARFLNPAAQIICRSTLPRHQKHLETMQGVTVINPFELFATQLGLAASAPQLFNLSEWFVGAHDTTLGKSRHIRQGHWVLCGYGRMGSCIQREFASQKIATTVIDPEVEEVVEAQQTICGHADAETLAAAGIDEAAGLVAGTNSDTNNLDILLSARRFTSDAFVIVRQNQHENELAFNAASVDLIMQASLVTARNILLRLIAPAMQSVIDYLKVADPEVTAELVHRLQRSFGEEEPQLLSITLGKHTPAIAQVNENSLQPRIADIIRDPSERTRELLCVPLALTRGTETAVLPASTEMVQQDDSLLFCASDGDARRVLACLENPQRLTYLITGYEEPTGHFFKWLTQRVPGIEQFTRRFEG